MQCALAADVDDTRRFGQFQCRPKSADDFQSYARTPISERHQRFTP